MKLDLNYKPLEVVSTAGMSEEDWLAWRRKGIGGSDAAAVMGLSPYRTARDLYYDKKNIRPATDDAGNWVALKVGHLLEPLVAEIFSAKTGYRTFQIKKMFRHPLFPFMQADVDYFLDTPDGRTGILECKTANPAGREKWANDSVPLHYEWQCRHYMAVMNLDFVWIACLFSNSEDDFVMRRIERDLDIEADMIEMEQDFWDNHVLANVEPPYVEKGDMVLDSIRRHYGTSDPAAAVVAIDPLYAGALEAWIELREKKLEYDRISRQLDAEMKKLIAPVADKMGTSEKGVCSDGSNSYRVTFASKYRSGVNKDDLQRLKLNHPALYEDYVTQTESRSIAVKKGA